MSDRSVRIRTDLSKDKVVHFNVTQDYDFLEILSLKIKQEDTYKLQTPLVFKELRFQFS